MTNQTVGVTEEKATRFVAVVTFMHDYYGSSTRKQYDFLCDLHVMDGDVVVVETVNGLQLANVIGIKRTSTRATKWVVSRVDMSAFNARRERELQLLAIKKKMETRAKKLDELSRYRLLAQEDAEMAHLLQQFNQMTAEQEGLFAWLGDGK